jgi:hypothetical protein
MAVMVVMFMTGVASAQPTGSWGATPKKENSKSQLTGSWGTPKKENSKSQPTGSWGTPKKENSKSHPTGSWGNLLKK